MGAFALKRYTYEDYLKWPDIPRYELIDGIPYLLTTPNTLHAEITGELCGQLWHSLKGKPCKVYHAPIDVRLFVDIFNSGDSVVQPDIIVVRSTNRPACRNIGWWTRYIRW